MPSTCNARYEAFFILYWVKVMVLQSQKNYSKDSQSVAIFSVTRECHYQLIYNDTSNQNNKCVLWNLSIYIYIYTLHGYSEVWRYVLYYLCLKVMRDCVLSALGERRGRESQGVEIWLIFMCCMNINSNLLLLCLFSYPYKLMLISRRYLPALLLVMWRLIWGIRLVCRGKKSNYLFLS